MRQDNDIVCKEIQKKKTVNGKSLYHRGSMLLIKVNEQLTTLFTSFESMNYHINSAKPKYLYHLSLFCLPSKRSVFSAILPWKNI